MRVPGVVVCGGIYRDHSGNHLGSFSMNIEIVNAFMAELTVVMMVIEITKEKN